METADQLIWQPSLFGAEEPAPDPGFGSLVRVELDEESWLDHAPGWMAGADRLFAEIAGGARWGQRRRRMYDRVVDEPRLTSGWRAGTGEPLDPAPLEAARRALSQRYGVAFDSVGINLYRDGSDSVAWHRDRIPVEIDRPVVALLSLGEPRRFLLRPHGGGISRALMLGSGDLLVTGGQTQRRFDHSVPKVARAGPRMSVAFRYGVRIYPG
ncbi:MAG TPA: alpha-ketoglutarate-dependent dioxygenase AlkB [Acidimicrobiales bacterium]|nr:alpha-ketoglutarate-dependent dioxygenase AlkB [Acidimicrobiales bacterium]